MHIEQQDIYKVACYIDRRDMREHGISLEDIVNRTPLGRMLIQKASKLSKESTGYEWPGCAFSMQIHVYQKYVELIFSERIDDYLYNLRQSMAALPKEQAAQLDKMTVAVAMAEEEEAREMIRKFEINVKNIGEKK